MFLFAELGGRVDIFSHEPGFPIGMGAPHDDALKVRDTVESLPDIGINWAKTREFILPDLWRWVEADEPIISRMQLQPRLMLAHHARCGSRPDWELGPAKVVRVNAGNGKPRVQYLREDGEIEIGLTPGGRYGRLAHCPLQLVPDARKIARARAEYWVWRGALVEVKRLLEGRNLLEHTPLMPAAPREPWLINTEPKSRILPSIRPARAIA